jgi:hypothetical protein
MSTHVEASDSLPPSYSPLVSREVWARMCGLPVGVVTAQAERGLLPQVRIGKRTLINVEALRLKAAERGGEFSL